MSDTHADRRINQAGLDLVKEREGFFARQYICPAGKPSIGYGHVILAGEHFDEPISREQGEDLLRGDLAIAEEAVGRLVTAPLNENQFSALVSFTFNVGQGNLQKSTLLKMLNAGDYSGAAEQFGRWIYADGKPLEGLKIRREMEAALFKRPLTA
ncbi:MAG: lysozyme [Desulfarculus sp.]|nr:lysozyme [Desulfarculus sp.]